MIRLTICRDRSPRPTSTLTGIIVILTTILLLSGCSKTGRPAGNNRAPADLILATTTSTYDTGLLDKLIPAFTKRYGHEVKVIAVGTGEALAMGERQDVDVLLVHAPDAEEEFMSAGYGASRRSVMYNWFVLVGPEEDPGGAGAAENIEAAFRSIADKRSPFVSRADDSGTHKKELALWEAAGRQPRGAWYQEAGQGMAATLRIADEKQGYALSDEGTFRTQQRTLSLLAFEIADDRLKNKYSVIVVENGAAGSDDLSRFLVSAEGQSLIKDFRAAGEKKPLFTPGAR